MRNKVAKELRAAALRLTVATRGTDNEMPLRRAYRLFKRRYKEFKRAGR